MVHDRGMDCNRQNQRKRNKFFQLKDEIHESHPHITEWLDSKATGRALQTEIIENCFKPASNNEGWKLDLSNPPKESKGKCVCGQHGSLW